MNARPALLPDLEQKLTAELGLKISLPDDATSCALTFRFWSYFWGGKEALLHHHRRHRLGACRVGAWNAGKVIGR
jgi:hypothetical protein